MKHNIFGSMVVSAVTSMVVGGASYAETAKTPTKAPVKSDWYCQNATCKGHTDCHTALHMCKGQNTTKSDGWLFRNDKKSCETKTDGVVGKWVKGKKGA